MDKVKTEKRAEYIYCKDTLKSDEDIIKQAKKILKTKVLENARREAISCPNDAKIILKDYLTVSYGMEHKEHFGIVLLDTQNRVLKIEELFQGTIDSASVYPREIVRSVILNNASSVFLFHNHPSHTEEASRADRAMTDKIKSALYLIDVRVLDHFIVCGDTIVTFSEQGFL